jgi:hypothetical protein
MTEECSPLSSQNDLASSCQTRRATSIAVTERGWCSEQPESWAMSRVAHQQSARKQSAHTLASVGDGAGIINPDDAAALWMLASVAVNIPP